jgi:signal transduction histidine kinase
LLAPIEEEKRLFILPRYVLIAAGAYLFLSEGNPDSLAIIARFIAAALLSNILLSLLPESLVLRPLTVGLTVCADVAWITASLCYKGNFGSDIVFLYFFVLFLAGAGHNVVLIIGAGVLLSGVDLAFSMESGKGLAWISSSMIRLPIIFAIAFFYSHLAAKVTKEREHALLKERLAEQLAGVVDTQEAGLRQQAEELRKNYERLKEQTAELEKANKAKDEFLSVISHELRTPANVIIGYVEVVRSKMLGEINDEQAQALTKAIDHSKALLKLITDILCTTSIEAGALRVESHAVSLKEFLDDLRTAYDSRKTEEPALIWDYPPDLPMINTDSQMLRQILQNLLDNAIKFTERGTVSTAAKYIPQTASVEFRISDTGLGIAEESLPHVFEAFRQVDSSATRSYGGVGLGLYVVKKYTDRLGGMIAVKSRVREGSTFTVTIPVKQEKSSPPQREEQPEDFSYDAQS